MQGKVLLLSQRKVATLVAYCLAYEFEDTVAAVTNAQRIDVTDLPSVEFSRRVYKYARAGLGSAALARKLAPAPKSAIVLDSDVELFFPIFNHTYELYTLASIPNWRKRSRKAVCFISELWSDMLPRYLVELLAEFDAIFLGTRNSVQDVARITGRPCTYMPLAVDVLRFMPASVNAPRPIDAAYIGRRSEITHQALLAHAEKKGLFYYYDTVAASGDNLSHRTFRVDRPDEHRRLLASLMKHAKYSFANRSYVNRPEFTAGREETSSRFYEGAASGTVMLGEAPNTPAFRSQFDWPDAVINVPFDSPDIGRILAELDAAPERLHAARVHNLRGAVTRHDWLHRLQVVFEAVGLPASEGMQVRAKQLEAAANRVLAS